MATLGTDNFELTDLASLADCHSGRCAAQGASERRALRLASSHLTVLVSQEMAAVTATRNFVRNLGGALGLALAGTVLCVVAQKARRLRKGAHWADTALCLGSNKSATAALLPLGWSGERVRAALSHSGTLLAGGAADAADGAALREAYRRGFQRVFQLLASLAGAAFVVAALLMKHRDVDRDDDERLRLEAQARSHARSSEERSGAGVEEEKRHTPQPA
jgi:hypothetical protein